AIRETAALLQELGFVPIIEPVKESLSGLRRSPAPALARPEPGTSFATRTGTCLRGAAPRTPPAVAGR
ncbi:MAG: hypothetical protein OXU20_06920, partial [Myxococcales bacterium]|nr:hypothetical protein [Myxococcales bacterium]MDD9965614.1 hypothetical protein [Myxococcales bacterium]